MQIDWIRIIREAATTAGITTIALKSTGLLDSIHVTDSTLGTCVLIAVLLQAIIHAVHPPRKPSQG